MKDQSKFPPGWDEARVRRVLEHYEGQSAAEDEAAFVEMIAAMPPHLKPTSTPKQGKATQ